MADQFDFDVFISYSSHEGRWVREELLRRVEGTGLKAFIDYRDFTRGAPGIKEMERGIMRCRKTLLVLSPDYVSSEWCEMEAIMAGTLSPANRDLRLIPLLKKECKKPLRIGALTHIDFTDSADCDLAWRQLLTALGAPPELKLPEGPEHEDWFLAHPYPMPPNFTGRRDERAMLSRWLVSDAAHPLLSLRALGGFGKSALAWHWLVNDVSPAVWPRVVWWSFYEGDASFDNFLAESLDYLCEDRSKQKELSDKDKLKAILEVLHRPGTLLVLDGFERLLRAFGGLDAAYLGDEPRQTGYSGCHCISLLADLFLSNVAAHPHLQSKVLLTTRLCPTVLQVKGGGLLQGCREEELKQMQAADAVAFFRSQGVRGTHTEIERACTCYGYHPLSLRLLTGLILSDFQQPGDIAAAKRLDVSGDLVQRQNHVLTTAYASLTPTRRTLLDLIACFRVPMLYDDLRVAMEDAQQPVADFDADLRDLMARGLLHREAKQGRFDLHPIVRRYTYDRLAATDRASTHARLRDYFAAVAKPDKVSCVEDLSPMIEHYYHTVRAGQSDEAFVLFRQELHSNLFYQLGSYQLIIDLLQALLPEGEDRPSLKGKDEQVWTLVALGNSYGLTGQPRRAISVLMQASDLAKGQSNKRALAVVSGNLATQHLLVGALRAAQASQRRRIDLSRESMDNFEEALGHQEFGRLLAYQGAYPESDAALARALEVFESRGRVQPQGVTHAYRALHALLRLRCAGPSDALDLESAILPARRALELAKEVARARFPVERDYVRANWILGASYRVANQIDEAERHLHTALESCRRINMVDHEANVLIDLARLRINCGAEEEAQRLLEEALIITERCSYVLQGADTHIEMGKLALRRNHRAAAVEHARKARELAMCDGQPDHCYRAAYEEASELSRHLQP